MDPPLLSTLCAKTVHENLCNEIEETIRSNYSSYDNNLLDEVFGFFKRMDQPLKFAKELKIKNLSPDGADEGSHFICGQRVNFAHLRCFFSAPSFKTVEEDREATTNQIDLRTLFSPDELSKVNELEVASFLRIVSPEWIQTIKHSMPGVKHLHLLFTTLDTDDFRVICSSMPHLKSLRISNAREGANGIKNLNGISKLKNLATFSLTDNEFTQEEDIMELFQLEFLTSLDLSSSFFTLGSSELRNAKLFVGCGRVLLSLMHIDCSGNDISQEIVQQIVNTHPNLQSMTLLGTSYTEITHVETPGRDVEIRSIGNYKCCLALLKNINSPFLENKLGAILETINLKDEELEQLSTEHFGDLVMLLVQSFDDLKYNDKCDADFLATLYILPIENLFGKFANTAKHPLINVILKILKRWSNKREIEFDETEEEEEDYAYYEDDDGNCDFTCYEFGGHEEAPKNRIHGYGRSLLESYYRADISSEYFQQLFKILTETMMNIADIKIEHYPRDCVDLLILMLTNVNVDRLQLLGNTKPLKKRLMEILWEPDSQKYFGLVRVRNMFQILYFLNEEIKYRTEEINNSIVLRLMAFIDSYKKWPEVQQRFIGILKKMEPQTRGMLNRSTLINQRSIKTICSLLLNKGSVQQQQMTKLLVSFYFNNKEHGKYSPNEKDESQLHEAFKDHLRRYRNDDQTDDFELFKSIVDNSRNTKLVMMAHWVLQSEQHTECCRVIKQTSRKRRRSE